MVDTTSSSTRRPTFSAQVAAVFIRAYQRWISPYKGFRCAHRKLHGGRSCSEFARHEILDRGVRDAIPGIRQQFHECGEASRILRRRQRAAISVVASEGYDLAQPDQPEDDGQAMIDRIWEEQERKQQKLTDLPSNESSFLKCSDGAFFDCGTCEFVEPFCCWSPW